MPDALLKLLVKDKLLHSGKIPMNAKERQLRPLRRVKQDYMSTNQRERLAGEAPKERETRLQQMRDRLAAGQELPGDPLI